MQFEVLNFLLMDLEYVYHPFIPGLSAECVPCARHLAGENHNVLCLPKVL